MSPPGPRVSERLRAVSNAEELHLLLVQLASEPSNRWNRTKILFYLPPALHGLAEEYFRGERLVVPQRRPVQVQPVELIELEQALAGAAVFADGDDGPADTDLRFRPRSVHDLTADPPAEEDDVIGHVLQALLQEIEAVDREAPKRYRLSNGRCVGPLGSAFVYVFAWSSEPELFVPGELQVVKTRHAARVGRQADGERSFELHLDEYLGPSIPQAVFWIDPTFLLRAAFEKLSAFRDVYTDDTGVARRLFARPASMDVGVSPVTDGSLNTGQRHAVGTARTADLGYVWGPPGTGKTFSLGYLIRDLVAARQRVLVMSPYNTAVDEAILSAHRQGRWAPGGVVRLGRISEEVRRQALDLESMLEVRAERSGLLSRTRELHASVMRTFQVEDRPAPATVRRCLEELGEIVVRIGKEPTRRAEVRRVSTAMQALRRAFRKPEQEILASASVVGTTISLSLVSALVYARPFDHVIVDEASVVRTPEALLVALMSGARVTFFGDPKQLPAIVKSRTPEAARWLRRSPFALAAIERPSDAQGACAMLTEQHRMAPPIRLVVSEMFYEGTLRDGNCPESGRVMLLDTSETPAEAHAKWIRMSQSKENLIHRTIVGSMLDAVRRDDRTSNVLVLSPFRAQKLAYEREPNTARFPGVKFATVHTSQGTESDIVVIDLVLAPGRGRSRFLDEDLTPEFRNLLNVAMSRARSQLFFVAHARQIREQFPNGLLDRLFQRLEARSERRTVPADLRMRPLWEDLFRTRPS